MLPIIIGVYLRGWLGSELSLRMAVILGDLSPRLTLILFSFSFVCTLAAAIVILTLAGRELGIRQRLPEDEREVDDRDTSIGEPGLPDPGAVWVVAELEALRHDPAKEFYCGAQLAGPEWRLWSTTSVRTKRAMQSCPIDLVVGQPVRF